MGFLSDLEKTVEQVANRPLLPGLFKQGQPKGDPPKDDKGGKK
jgi:hypothetical protein